MTTRGSVETASRTSYAYGCERSSSGDLQTDRTFTGQKRDATGLKYDNDRCYDPALGTFVSPDYMVPNAARVIDHEPLSLCKRQSAKVHLPAGYSSRERQCSTQECWGREFCWKERWYRAQRGYVEGIFRP